MPSKKLIEVALPLEAISRESVREGYIYKGNPSSLHKWWAQRPLAACRAVLFASLVDDPSSRPEDFPTDESQEAERQRLFRIIEKLVKWENSNNEQVLAAARAEIMKSTGGNPPPVLDPFCGGGSIPLEAQRLGLEAHASDLNPVAILITKALIEIPPKFANRAPVNPETRKEIGHGSGWRGARGLAEDVRYYGKWMRAEAEKRIGHLYPQVKLPREYGGGEATVIAWLWARTVKCPNPACGARMPLVRSFWLSTKEKKRAWVEPIVDCEAKTVRFEVRTGDGSPGEGTKQRGKARCVFCESNNISDAVLREQATRFRMGQQLMAVVGEGRRSRIYLPPSQAAEVGVNAPKAEWLEQPLPNNARWFSPPGYGLPTYRHLFTPRQLLALTTFSDLVGEARERVRADAVEAGMPNDGVPLNDGGTGAQAYADAVATYLAFAVDKAAEYNCTIVPWYTKEDRPKGMFARQAIPMVWDFAEVNPLGTIGGTLLVSVSIVAQVLDAISANGANQSIRQSDAGGSRRPGQQALVATDPPYYDNIGYADLSDFFYVWLRRSLGQVYPDLFRTLLVPKSQELVATPYRFGGDRDKARTFFEEGFARAFAHLRKVQDTAYPLTVYYAFKQAEANQEHPPDEDASAAVVSTGWETMLEGLLRSGFAITGTWPMRTERGARSVGLSSNALASSVVLACRPRGQDAGLTTRRDFLTALKRELPPALRLLQRGSIAPVDLAQASIGPGMAVFSRYSKVLEADGSPMAVRTALALINETLDEILAEQEGEFDADTRWAVAWFEQFGMEEGPFGVAETLSKAKNTAVSGLVEAGVLSAKAGKVRLLRREELDGKWDPSSDRRLTVWEVTQHLIRVLQQGKGELGASALLGKVGGLAESARSLAYRLYGICERKKWAQEALAYNSLAVAWPEIARLAQQQPAAPRLPGVE